MHLRYTLFAFACWAIGTARCAGGPADAESDLPAGAVARLGDVRFWWKNCYVSSLVFSPDCKTLAVAASRYQYERIEEPAVRLLEIPSRSDRRRLQKLPPAMAAVAFSPDGKSLTGIHSSDDGYSLRLSAWDLAERTRRYSFELGNQQSPAVAYSPDGRCLAATAYRAVSLRDAATGRELRRLQGHETEVVSLAFSPDGKLLASSSSATDSQGKYAGSTILLWDVAAGKSLRKIAFARQAPFPVLQFSSDGKILAAWKRHADILLYDVSTGRQIQKIAGRFWTVAFSADGKFAATGGPTIRLWELPAGRELRSFPGYAEMRLLTFSPDGARMELEKHGELAEEALRKTLQSRPSLEMRRRIEGLLARLHQFPPPAELLRMSRAMLALEWMDTAEARRLIESLAQGTPGARLTREAKAAQQRLSRLAPPKP